MLVKQMISDIKLNVDRLRALREQRGMSQRELSRRCEIGDTQIGKYEAGIVEPSAAYLGRIAEVLDVSADYLLGRTDDRNVSMTDHALTDEEIALVKQFRAEGWPGVVHLGVERLAK